MSSAELTNTSDIEQELSSRLTALRVSQVADHYTEKQELLTFLWEKSVKIPQVVAKYGYHLLSRHANKLGNQVWDMYERVCLAALESQDDELSRWCVSKLEERWPGSLRVKRLRGMLAESQMKFAEAEATYADILKTDPTNVAALKRSVCVSKARGDVGSCLSLLARYLKLNPNDEAAWSELLHLYVVQNNYQQAAFCAEELILLTAENYIYHQIYAELLFALGKYELARQYFAQSVELKPLNNLRAMYGLLVTMRQKNGGGSAALYEWVYSSLTAQYTKHAPHLLPLLKTFSLDTTQSSTTSNQENNSTTQASQLD